MTNLALLFISLVWSFDMLYNGHVLEFKKLVINTRKFGITPEQLATQMNIPVTLVHKLIISENKIKKGTRQNHIYRCESRDSPYGVIFMNLMELRRADVPDEVIDILSCTGSCHVEGLRFQRIKYTEIDEETDLIM